MPLTAGFFPVGRRNREGCGGEEPPNVCFTLFVCAHIYVSIITEPKESPNEPNAPFD